MIDRRSGLAGLGLAVMIGSGAALADTLPLSIAINDLTEEGLEAIAVQEEADGNVLLGSGVNHFFDTTTLQPVAMPGDITITVKSDVVPEPTSLLLLATGVVGLLVAAGEGGARGACGRDAEGEERLG